MRGLYRDPAAARAELLEGLDADAVALEGLIAGAARELRALEDRTAWLKRRRWRHAVGLRLGAGLVGWVVTTFVGLWIFWAVFWLVAR